MKQENLKKKVCSLLLVLSMLTTLLPVFSTEVHAAVLPDTSQFVTKEQLKDFDTNDTSGNNPSAKVYFGKDNQKWWIAGSQSDDSLVLFAASPLAENQQFEPNNNSDKSYSADWNCTYPSGNPTKVYSNHYGASEIRQTLNGLETSYFTGKEQDLMQDITIYTNDQKNSGVVYSTTDKLYLAYGDYGNQYVTVGTNSSTSLNDGLRVDNHYWGSSDFLVRSPYYNNTSLVTERQGFVIRTRTGDKHTVVPAFELNLSSVLFASAVPAVSSEGTLVTTPNEFTLRYVSTGDETATINAAGSKVVITNASNNMYLVVQNSTGAYAKELASTTTSVSADEIEGIDDFNNSKVWLETTDTTNRITTAKMATQAVADISSVAIEDITAPVASSTFDTTAVCNTEGVSTTTPTVTWIPNDTTVGYNKVYTASVTVSVAENYVFADDITATVNGNNATIITKNDDGTLTVSYNFTTAAKAVSNEYFATVEDLKDCYNLTDGTIGKIKFGKDGEGLREWAIVGNEGNDLALLSTTEFEKARYGSDGKYSTSNFVGKSDEDGKDYLSSNYFSTSELAKMQEVTVKTLEYDQQGTRESDGRSVTSKLYLPDAKDRNSEGTESIYVGNNNNIEIDLTRLTVDNGFQNSKFWLRSPYVNQFYYVLIATPRHSVELCNVHYHDVISVAPALNLNLSSVLFASAVNAVSSDGELTTTANEFTLRYSATDSIGKATIINLNKNVAITGITNDNTYLVVQNNEGAWAKKVSDDDTVLASDVTINGNVLSTFENCKVWLETTGNDRITYATQATVSAPIYAIDVDKTSLTFNAKNEGYSTDTLSQSITITNTGNVDVTNINVTLTGTNAFMLDKAGLKTTLTPNGKTSVSIRPKVDLEVGTYTANVQITGETGITKTIPISFTVEDHDYEDKVTLPTCTKKGYTTHTCKICGHSYIDSETDVIAHEFKHYVSDNNATCTKDGTETAKCEHCEATDTRIEVNSALGHDFKEWEVVKHPTTTLEGEKVRKCSRCDAEEKEILPVLEKKVDKSDNIETRDNTNLMLWVALLFISGMAIGILNFQKRKTNKS